MPVIRIDFVSITGINQRESRTKRRVHSKSPMLRPAKAEWCFRNGNGYLDFVMAFSLKSSSSFSRVKPRNPKFRRIGNAVAGVLLVLFSGFLFLVINLSASQRVEALAIDDRVAQGTIIDDDDLRVVKVAASDGAHYVPASKKSDVVGSVALVSLSEGTVLSTDVFEAANAKQSKVTVAALVRPGFAPSLKADDRVTIVGTTTPQASVFGGSKSDLGKKATTIGIGKVIAVNNTASASGDIIVSLEVDPKIAADVAAASSAGGLALIADSSDKSDDDHATTTTTVPNTPLDTNIVVAP
jgi:hypothetical protein